MMMETIVLHKVFKLQVCQRDFANELINRVIAPNVDVSTAIQDKVSKILNQNHGLLNAFTKCKHRNKNSNTRFLIMVYSKTMSTDIIIKIIHDNLPMICHRFYHLSNPINLLIAC